MALSKFRRAVFSFAPRAHPRRLQGGGTGNAQRKFHSSSSGSAASRCDASGAGSRSLSWSRHRIGTVRPLLVPAQRPFVSVRQNHQMVWSPNTRVTSSGSMALLPVEFASVSKPALKMHFNTAAKSYPIIFFHGMMASSANWLNIACNLSSSCNLSAFRADFRNHGDAAYGLPMGYPQLVHDALSSLREQRIEKAIFIGHSMGGKVAMQLALDHPELVHKLLVVDAAPMCYSHVPALLSTIQKITDIDLRTCKSPEEVDQQLQTKIRDRTVRSSLLKNLRVGPDGSLTWGMDYRALASSLYNLVCNKFPVISERTQSCYTEGPVLFVKGSKSHFLNDEGLAAARKYFPKLRLTELDAGHLLYEEREEEFTRIAEEFVKEA